MQLKMILSPHTIFEDLTFFAKKKEQVSKDKNLWQPNFVYVQLFSI